MGVLCSIIHFMLVFAFAILKLSFVATQHSPSISVFDEIHQHETQEDGIDIDEIGFQIALAITDSGTGEIKNDPRYV